MEKVLVLAFLAVGCSSRALPATGECRWSLSRPTSSSGVTSAVFDYAAHSGCIGVRDGATANFGFNIEISVGDKLTRFNWGVPDYPAAGTVINLADPSTIAFVSANGWACATFDGNAIVVASTPSNWRVELDGTCREDNRDIVGIFEGDTSRGYALN